MEERWLECGFLKFSQGFFLTSFERVKPIR